MEEITKPGADLDQVYDNVLEEIEAFGEAKTHFVNDQSTADWSLRKLSQFKNEDDEDVEEAERHVREWQEWLLRRRQQRQASIDYFARELTVYAENQRLTQPKWKLDVPGGRVSFTVSRKDTLTANADKDALLHFVKDNWDGKAIEDVVTVKETVNSSAVKKYLTITPDGKVVDEDGQITPGFDVKKSGTAKIIIKPSGVKL